jgi:hypothetical protein
VEYVVASVPQISPLRAELCSSPAAAIRQPGYLPARRPLGFASPPRSGFAFPQLTRMRQPAGTFPMLAMNAPYSESSTHAIPPEGFFPHMDEACVWLRVTLSLLMPALLPVCDESAMNHSRTSENSVKAKFAERLFHSLRGIEATGKGGPWGNQEEGRGGYAPALSHLALELSLCLSPTSPCICQPHRL